MSPINPFTEANTVRDYVRDLLTQASSAVLPHGGHKVGEGRASYVAGALASASAGLGWQFVPGAQLPRQETDVLVGPHLIAALIRLNPEIAAQPDRADEVIYRLRAIIGSVRDSGLVRANEEFTQWLRGDKSMPFGEDGQHTAVHLIDFETLANNRFVVSTEVTFRHPEKRFDVVLWVNGIPLVVGEAKTATRASVTWADGAIDVYDDYERNVPAFFVPNVLSFATEGKTYRYGAIRNHPLDDWVPWREAEDIEFVGLNEVGVAVRAMFKPEVLLDILQHFTLFATNKQGRRSKIICRFQQYQAANQIVQRVIDGAPKKGLIWHFQGSGKSLLMVFAAQKLRLHPALRNPTVIVAVDRIDLDTQITSTFNATDIPNTETIDSRATLQRRLAHDSRKILITTIHKFGEAPGVLNDRDNIILMVDEAHRTQEGELGRKMREALPNAFLFGLTGTPINKRDRNTFIAFGADEDDGRYMSRYSFEESIRDNATLPLRFEPRLIELHIDQDKIDVGYQQMTGALSEADRARLSRQAARLSALVKAPERVKAIAADVVHHYRERIEPNGFKAMIVTYDRESCLLVKRELDALLGKDASTIVMSVNADDDDAYLAYKREKDEEERVLDQFRDPNDPLKFLIVTARLLAGFDAKVLQVMYLDKPIKEHNLLQAICRVNRPMPKKEYGLIVDYLGVFDDVGQAFNFDEQAMKKVVSALEAIKAQLPALAQACLAHFPGVDRSIVGYEGLLAAQECLPTNEQRDAFAADFSMLAKVWEALSPDPVLQPYARDYVWLAKVYESLQPPNGRGRLIWQAFGAKTAELIHANVSVVDVHDTFEPIVIDATVVESLSELASKRKGREIEFKLVQRIKQRPNDPKFVALGERLEQLRQQMERGLITSLQWLKDLIRLAGDAAEAIKRDDPQELRHTAEAALTELFNSVKTDKTPLIVSNIVKDIDDIVKVVRFDGWQRTIAGEREVKQALRKVLLKYQLHRDQDLFERAYGYIRQYY
jgi:type I restriction enzyme R subunit